jgi:hypothetical protein
LALLAISNFAFTLCFCHEIAMRMGDNFIAHAVTAFRAASGIELLVSVVDDTSPDKSTSHFP